MTHLAGSSSQKALQKEFYLDRLSVGLFNQLKVFKKSIFLLFCQFLSKSPEQLRQVGVRRGEGSAGRHQVGHRQLQQQQGCRDPAGEPQQAVDAGGLFFSKKLQ